MRMMMLIVAWVACLPLGAQDFSMECGDLRRSNAVTTTAMVFPLDVQWMAQSCLAEPANNPLVVRGSVIIHNRDGVEAMAAADGQFQWVWRSYGVLSYLWNDPAWDPDRGLLYVTGWNGGLVALRAADGQPQWSIFGGTTPHGGSRGAPTYLNGQILFADGRGGYTCLNAADQSQAWRWTFNNIQCGNTPGIDAGLAYVGGNRGELACVRLSDGSTVWRLQDGTRPFSGAVLLDDTQLYVPTAAGLVECRSRADGSFKWSYQMDSYWQGNLAIHNGVLFSTSDDRCVYAVDCSSGALKWKTHHTGNFARSSPFVCGDDVFSSGCTGEFYGDSEGSGATDWVLAHGADNSFNDWAYADGQLFSTNRLGRVFCLRNHCPACTPTVSVTPSMTESPSATVTPTATPSATATGTPSDTASPSPSASPTATGTSSVTASPTDTPTLTMTASITASPTATPTPTITASVTASPTATPSVSPSATATISVTPSASPTAPPSTPSGDATAGLDDPGDGCYNYPNPSHGQDVWAVYRVSGPCHARIRVFQSAGDPAAKVDTDHSSAGVKRCQLPSHAFAPGIYFYKVDLEYQDGHKESKRLSKFVCSRN